MKSYITMLILLSCQVTSIWSSNEESNSIDKEIWSEMDTSMVEEQHPHSKNIQNAQISSADTNWEDNIGFWTVSDSDSKHCLLLRSAINITLKYDSKIINLSVPKNATSSGSCGPFETQDITLSWNDTLDSYEIKNYLQLTFTSNWSSVFIDEIDVNSDQYALHSVEVRSCYGNGTLRYRITASGLAEFLTPKNHSYVCKLDQILPYDKIQLRLANFQVEAFRESSIDTTFGPSIDCSTDIDNKKWHLKIVMIIVCTSVSCFLIALGVIAFVILRRRRIAARESSGDYRILEE